jgi:hypothetical protein
MQILILDPPNKGGSLYVGEARSRRGRKYSFCATFDGRAVGTFREYPQDALRDGRTFWLQIKPPKALSAGVRTALRKQRRR